MGRASVTNQVTLSVNQDVVRRVVSMSAKFHKEGCIVPLNKLFGTEMFFALHLPPKDPNFLTVASGGVIAPEHLVEAKLMLDFALDLRHYLNGTYENFEQNFPEFVKIFANTQNAHNKVETLIR